MPYKLIVQQFADEIAVEDGETILEAAIRTGHDYPSDCRNGVCGECKCALISGSVDMKQYLDVALDEDEKQQGYILGCRSMLRSDCEIALLDREEAPPAAFRSVEATVQSIERVTHDIALVQMVTKDGRPFDFAPGQYANVQFSQHPPRSYSFANTPTSNLLEFHIRAVPGGRVSPHLYADLKPGDEAVISGPKGMAYLRKQHTGPIVFCAGGSGLAPILSMIRWLSREQVARTAYVFFGVRSERDVYCEAEITRLCKDLGWGSPQIVLSSASGETASRKGFLADAIRQDLTGCEGMKAYLCGPPIMIETCRKSLLNLGLARQDCHADVFWTPAS